VSTSSAGWPPVPSSAPASLGPDRQRLVQELEAYVRGAPERRDVAEQLLGLLSLPANPFERSHLHPGHFTASAFVLCPERRRLLLIRHPKLGRWLQPGGHVEASDVTLLAAARREVQEETGVDSLEPFEPGIFDVDVHLIPPTAKEGAHAHFDVRYAFVAPREELTVSNEVKAARWVELEAVAGLNDEESIARPVQALTSRLFSGGRPR
jgi:8-oxo-dGTP pyrophosphatase MutT (NUDIX family)